MKIEGEGLLASGSRKEAVVDLQHESCEGDRIDRVTVAPLTAGVGPAAIVSLVLDELVTEELVVSLPLLATVVDHGLTAVVVLVEVGLAVGEIELGVLVNIFNASACLGVGRSLVLLEAESSGTGQGEMTGGSDRLLIETVAEATILGLSVFQEVESI